MPGCRRVYPALIANNLIGGVLPVTAPTGNISTLKVIYSHDIPKIRIYCGSDKAELDWSNSDDSVNYNDMVEWCEQQFGPHYENPRWNYYKLRQIVFRDKQDYVLFLLRWSA
jgi:hypothetical protein